MNNNPLYDPKLMSDLLALREHDEAAFFDLILSTLKNYPELAVTDSTETSAKLRAMERMLAHYESLEFYEDCGFIVNLKKQIEDEKDKVHRNQQ